jgi:hypothetical protein
MFYPIHISRSKPPHPDPAGPYHALLDQITVTRTAGLPPG